MHDNRIKTLQKQLKYPLLVVKKENLFYFTGQHFIDGCLLVTKKDAIFFGNGLEQLQKGKSDQLSNFSKYLKGGRTVLIENVTTLEDLAHFKRVAKGVKFEPVSGMVEAIRSVKSKAELESLRHAYEITAAVFATVKTQLKKKQWTEIGLARYIRVWGLELGADEVSFDPIVASGGHAAIPHHRPDTTVIKAGESVVLDFGFKINGYCSDFTRTVFLGHAPKALAEAYEKVEAAYNLAIESARVGQSGHELDAVARNYLAEYKLDTYFIHSLGHGTGLEVHEQPWVSPRALNSLENGMVFSIEPGAYFAAPKHKPAGGIRIEDLFYLEEGRAQYFVRVPTDLKSNIIK